ncbi:LacI family transcriptional regulator [Actinoplanes octamycinicus]|uniref:LacI family transcriptional regulator n=1 Tax=Actinoplanes octamycinicus TaxID=135948 RepID=A0A7W7M6D3_9ACTN|nr:LacI family DNA-binding transcriptional regulator [Actinoplanes octamycinicus]MBB4738663.1 LacI family transcriptional regulator [Actinoplanes octamycinicus]GIE61396.1 DNA-binding protein [Actinoplanes octamycinicus]
MGPQKPIILYGVKPPHRIQEIAARAGLSPATVDRVLHQRGGVRDSTARRVHRAVAELDRESERGRVLTVDLVLPASFGADVPAALDPDLPIQARTHLTDDPAGALDQVARSRSDGVIVLAPPLPEVTDAVARLDVPVVTLNVDLPAGKRIAHVGVDDFEAGATAAYLVEQWLHERAGDVLVVGGRAAERRVAGFRSVLGPARRLHLLTGPDQARATLAGTPTVRAVYAPAAAGCAEVVAAFAAEQRNYDVFVAHGLDPDTLALLRAQQISAVLHQDLRADLRHACRAILRAHGVLPGPIRSHPAAVGIFTPFNVPVS